MGDRPVLSVARAATEGQWNGLPWITLRAWRDKALDSYRGLLIEPP